MRTSTRRLWVVGAILSIQAGVSHAAGLPSKLIIGSLVPESGFIGPQNADSYPLTATPYDFTGQDYANFGLHISGIERISVTLTMIDGDSAPGEFDFGNLTLGLDGIDTGLRLDGFPDSTILTLTLTKLSPALQASLVAALQDEKVVGSVIDSTPGNAPAGDMIGFPSRIDTEIEIFVDLALAPPPPPAVPLPIGVLVAPLGACVAGISARRMRSKC
jgi:hypothetical protein